MKIPSKPVLYSLIGSAAGVAFGVYALMQVSATPASASLGKLALDPAQVRENLSLDGHAAIMALDPVYLGKSLDALDSGADLTTPVSASGLLSADGELMDVGALAPPSPSFAVRAALGEQVLQPPRPRSVVRLPGDSVDFDVSIARGETLLGLLMDQEVPRPVAVSALEALREHFNPRSLRSGQEIQLSFNASGTGDLDFRGMRFEPEIGTTISLKRDAQGSFSVSKEKAPLKRRVVRYDGTIQSSLFEAAMKMGTPQSVLADMIRVFSYDVDFQRDLKENDTFSIFYEQMDTPDGRTVRTGDLLFASMTVAGKKYSLYRYRKPDGTTEYYNEKGEGVRKALLRTPINGARLSSNFGLRRHPILGYSRMHKGVDFAAPRGTPIYAAGDGVILFAGSGRGYGNYVKVRHNGEFQTLYGHMSAIAKGMRPGVRVRQGQVIGYVGATGMATGPHLHYEIVRNGAHVNPAATRFMANNKLEGKELAAFRQERSKIDVAFQNTPSGTRVASAR